MIQKMPLLVLLAEIDAASLRLNTAAVCDTGVVDINPLASREYALTDEPLEIQKIRPFQTLGVLNTRPPAPSSSCGICGSLPVQGVLRRMQFLPRLFRSSSRRFPALPA